MDKTIYYIIFKGEVAQGHNQEDVKKRFVSIFNVKEEKINYLFSGKPALLKKIEDIDSVQKYKTAFERIGAVCYLQKKIVDNTEKEDDDEYEIESENDENDINPNTESNTAIEIESDENDINPDNESNTVIEIEDDEDNEIGVEDVVKKEDIDEDEINKIAGKIRSPGLVLIFFTATVGLYSLIYHFFLLKELKDWRGKGLSPYIYFIFPISIIILPWLIPFYIGKMYEEDGQDKPVSGITGFWIMVPLIGFFIWIFKIQNKLNYFWSYKTSGINH